jgi:hypothetical protein
VFVQVCVSSQGTGLFARSKHRTLLPALAAPRYHLLSLARDGIEAALESTELDEQAKVVIKKGIAIVNADGSVDDECAPLTMTLKARIYALGAPRSVEVRHEYHFRHG